MVSLYAKRRMDGDLAGIAAGTGIYILVMIWNALRGSPQRSFKKGFKLLRAWNFESAEKYLYPIMYKTGFNALDIYEMMYREAVSAGRTDLAERYLSEVRTSYGNGAAENIKNSR